MCIIAFMKYLKAADIPLIILLIVLSAIPLFSGSSRGSYAEVTTDEGRYLFSLSENIEREFDGPVGKTIVRIEDGSVRIIYSDCPEKTCTRGSISRAPGTLVCLPNHVSVTIKGEGDGSDAISY